MQRRRSAARKIRANVKPVSSVFAYANQDFQKYFTQHQQAYKIAQEINAGYALVGIGRDSGYFLCQAGQQEESRPRLEQAYQIGKAVGLPGTEEIKAMLDQVG